LINFGHKLNMVITADTWLPTNEELTVEEVNLSTNYLKAGAFHLGKKCEAANNDFMLCRAEEKDPRKCLDAGKKVTACSMEFFRSVKKNCAEEFTDYGKCLDLAGTDMELRRCRNTQAIFDTCMFEKLGSVRPHYGYFCEAKIHESSRPKPPPEPIAVYPDALPEIPDESMPRAPKNMFGTREFLY